MSIVPYYSENAYNRVVYHDPHNSILVVHNNQHNTVELHNVSARNRAAPEVSSDHNCPNCGIDLAEFFGRNSPEYAEVPRNRRSHQDELLRPSRSIRHPDRFSSLEAEASEFMHRDYFRLLAELPFEQSSTAIEAPARFASPLPGDLFNQGYFQRFFRKIPPEILGSGAHAQVYKVAHVLKNIQLGVFAVKRINVGDHSQYLEHVLNEVLILYELSVTGANENNLIRYNHVWMEYGAADDSGTFILGGERAARLPYVYILQQYCDGGHLERSISSNFPRIDTMQRKVEKERLRRRRKSSGATLDREPRKWLWDLEIWKFFADIANGVQYLHSHGILHRDLKPSNCLLESGFSKDTLREEPATPDLESFESALQMLPKVLVSDFGEGKFIDKSQNDERRGNTGTLEFTDPKLWVYAHFETRTFAYNFTYDCDIYSLGMILCYLCVGKLPFEEFISDPFDPDLVRSEIAKWHAALTPDSFHRWFFETAAALKGEVSRAQADFELLVYMMIKGDEKPTAQAVMEYLESMKKTFYGQQPADIPVKITETEDTAPKTDILPAVGYILNLVLLECFSKSPVISSLRMVHLAGLVKHLTFPGHEPLLVIVLTLCNLCVVIFWT